MSKGRTTDWYLKYWSVLNQWLSELAAKHVRRVYICNYEIIPDNIDKPQLIEIFNSDSNSWKMVMDEDGDLVCLAQ